MPRIQLAFAFALLIFGCAATASAAERLPARDVLPAATLGTVVPLPNSFGTGIIVLPARVTELLTKAVASIGAALPSEPPRATTIGADAQLPPERALAFVHAPEVDTYLRYFTAGRGRGTAVRGVARATPYRERAERIFREEGLPTDLIWLAQVESAWQPTAVSPAGACGLWQFIPATGERFGMTCTGCDDDERMDFEKSTRGAARYLRWLNERYDGNWELAIGAYNCGEGAMDRAIQKAGGVEDFWAISRAGLLPTETVNYVPAVLAATIFGKDPVRFGLDDGPELDSALGQR